MILPSGYYKEKLYPLQDGVLNTISRSDTDFFLTGGTALSRAYYNHRYSDDLDFFINQSQTYNEQLDTILALLREDGFFWNIENDYIRAEHFTTVKVGNKSSDILLKLDFVNDLVPHFGGIQRTSLFHRTDSIRNILSNKLSAVFRYASKDIADIREIALNESVNWKEAIQEARQKEYGIDVPYICEILKSMPESEFERISWTKKPFWEDFLEDIDRITFEMMIGA